jgi:hypothetical protein
MSKYIISYRRILDESTWDELRCSVAKCRIVSEMKVRQKGTRSFPIWYASVALRVANIKHLD